MKEDNTKTFLRIEDRRFLKGEGNYVDDIHPANAAHLGFVRSSYAHAKIGKIDFSRAREHPDFIDGVSGQDLIDKVDPTFVIPMGKQPVRYPLARDRVRHAGEAVAAFISKTKYSVDDIAELIEVEYEPLPAVLSIEESRKGKAFLYDNWNGSNLALEIRAGRGDPAKAIESSAHRIRRSIGVKRQAGIPIEPRAVVATYGSDTFEVHSAVQSAQRISMYLSKELKIPPEKIHGMVKDVGGGFGTKGAQSYPESSVACFFARKNGVPVKWASTRTEDLMETAHGRDEYCEIELGCDSQGKIVALRALVEADVGVGGTLNGMIDRTVRLLPGVYKIPNIEIVGRCYVTNKTPSGPVRGAGRPEACYFMERALDELSRSMKMDPAELRRRNLVKPEEFPYDNGAGYTYDSGNFPLLLEKILEKYEGLVKWKSEFNNKFHSQERAGVGISMQAEDTGAQLSETANMVLDGAGTLTIFTGSSPHGQGHETIYAETASKELGIPIENIKVVWGDTQVIPKGIGTFGSRSAAVGGSAVLDACRKLKAEILANLSENTGKDFVIRDGEILLGRKKIAGLSELVSKHGPFRAASEFAMSSVTFSSAAHLCALLVDLETGRIKLKNYFAVDDCGKVLNPVIVDGQMEGGIVHGIGSAVLEEITFDQEGQPLTTNLVDYTIPTALDVPEDFELAHVETPSPISLNGAKGVGESGTIGACPAILNALNDALSSMGYELNIAPATPQRVFESMRKSG